MSRKKISIDSGVGREDSSDVSSEGRCSPNIMEHVDPLDGTNAIVDLLDGTNATLHLTQSRVEGIGKEISNEAREYFKLSLTIVSGKNLISMDRNGKSDPFVRVMMDNKLICKTHVRKKTLSPSWDETFDIDMDRKQTLLFQVYDKDLVGKDFMGEAELDLESCGLETDDEINLFLQDGGDKHLKKFTTFGSLKIRVRLTREESESFQSKVPRSPSSLSLMAQLKINKKPRNAIVHVNLIESLSLAGLSSSNSCDLYCKLTVGNESYASKTTASSSKTIDSSSRNEWHQTFSFFWNLEDGNDLAVDLYTKETFKGNFLGKVSIDLGELTPEVSHNLWRRVDSREINLIVTISGITSSSPFLLLQKQPCSSEELEEKYSYRNTFSNIRDVGNLSVKVVKAEGLQSADFRGHSDPYCVLKLENTRLQTHTERHTLEPIWEKEFEFQINDINEVLELTVYDEVSNHKGTFLGKILCPLMEIQNDKTWYNLKDMTSLKKAKGNDPKILLEMKLHWNPIRASVQTLQQPKINTQESNTHLKFYRIISSFTKNIRRVKNALPEPNDRIAKEFQNVLKGQKTFQSACVYFGVVCGIWLIDLWMIPLALLIPFVPHLVRKLWFNKEKIPLEATRETSGYQHSSRDHFFEHSDKEKSSEECSEDSGDSDVEEFHKTNFKETVRMIHSGLEFLAHTLESVENVFKLSVPLLSWLAICMLVLLALILYVVPLRVLLILVVTERFLGRKTGLRRNVVKNFISKVPDKLQLEKQKISVDSLSARTTSVDSLSSRKISVDSLSPRTRRASSDSPPSAARDWAHNYLVQTC